MTTEDALHAAIAGGWDFKRAEVGGLLTGRVAFIDPLFWQSLGNVLFWGHLDHESMIATGRAMWHQMWLIFIDHLAAGKTANDFFQQLT
jgi:hypothetical protein